MDIFVLLSAALGGGQMSRIEAQRGVLVQRSAAVLSTEVGEDVVALNVERGQCYGMEDVTAAVWGLLTQPMGLDEICMALLEKYDVEPELCRLEVSELLAEFQREGLIELVDYAGQTGRA